LRNLFLRHSPFFSCSLVRVKKLGTLFLKTLHFSSCPHHRRHRFFSEFSDRPMIGNLLTRRSILSTALLLEPFLPRIRKHDLAPECGSFGDFGSLLFESFYGGELLDHARAWPPSNICSLLQAVLSGRRRPPPSVILVATTHMGHLPRTSARLSRFLKHSCEERTFFAGKVGFPETDLFPPDPLATCTVASFFLGYLANRLRALDLMAPTPFHSCGPLFPDENWSLADRFGFPYTMTFFARPILSPCTEVWRC